MTPLFVYGSLTFDEVLVEVLGRVPETRRELAVGWRSVRLQDRDFPGLVPAIGWKTQGRLLVGLTETEGELMRDYEGPFYELQPIATSSGATSRSYVLVDPDMATDETWNRDAFARDHLGGYITRCRAWRKDVDKLRGEQC